MRAVRFILDGLEQTDTWIQKPTGCIGYVAQQQYTGKTTCHLAPTADEVAI
jgi:hypothetical protein